MNQLTIAICFIVFLLLFTGVGISSATQKSNTTQDYLVASRNVNPWLMALSSFATAHSGFMFIGLIGWTYTSGISASWLMLGWFLGDYVTWFFVHNRLRQVSEDDDAETVGGFLAGKGQKSRAIAALSALITIVFLGTYAAGQLVAGSKALNAIFDWDYSVGIVLGAVVVVAYCFSGGIRASIWTDAVQSILMMISMAVLLVVAVMSCGGISQLWSQLQSIDPILVDPMPPNLKFGFTLFAISWFVAGVGVVGQPHIMIRAMSIDSVKHIGMARNIYAFCYVIFSVTAIGVGLTARVLLPSLLRNDPELALPQLAIELLPAVFVGIILAGVFAAVVSTADSQILSCSAALTQDLFPNMAHSYKLAKVGTLVVTAIILAIALSGGDVFSLSVLGWSVLAAGLGPLLVVRSWQLPVTVPVALAMMVAGISGTIVWRYGLQLSDAMSDVFPGMLVGTLVYLAAWRWMKEGRSLS